MFKFLVPIILCHDVQVLKRSSLDDECKWRALNWRLALKDFES
jgi:hypothetical protein